MPAVVIMNLADEDLMLKILPRFKKADVVLENGIVLTPLVVTGPEVVPLNSEGLMALKKKGEGFSKEDPCKMYNPDFNSPELEEIENEALLNLFLLS